MTPSTPIRRREASALVAALAFIPAGLALLASPARGEVFRWVNTSGGNFVDPANWEVDTAIDTTASGYAWNTLEDNTAGNWSAATRCPGSADLALFTAAGEYTVLATGDIELTSLRSGNNAIATLDMGGHELTCSRALSSSGTVWDNGSAWRLILTNGTFRCTTGYDSWNTWKGFGVTLGSNKNTERGRMVVTGPETHVVTTGRAYAGGNNSLVQLRGGASMLIEDGGRLEVTAAGSDVTLSIIGEGTTYEAGYLSIGSAENEIRDGATVTVSGFQLYGESPVRLTVDNATIRGLSAGLNGAPPLCIGARAPGSELLVSNHSVISQLSNKNVGVGYANGYTSVSNRMVLSSGSHLAATNAPMELSRFQASCSEMVVDDAKVDVKNVIVGAYSKVKVNGVEYAGGGSNNLFRVAGAAPLVRCFGVGQTSGTSAHAALVLNYHSTLQFDVPAAGWASAPIVLDTGKVASLREGEVPGVGALPNRLVVNARQWARDNPKKTIVLVQAGRDSSEGFNDLISCAEFDIEKPSLRPVLSVSADGRQLLLTAPSYPATTVILR